MVDSRFERGLDLPALGSIPDLLFPAGHSRTHRAIVSHLIRDSYERLKHASKLHPELDETRRALFSVLPGEPHRVTRVLREARALIPLLDLIEGKGNDHVVAKQLRQVMGEQGFEPVTTPPDSWSILPPDPKANRHVARPFVLALTAYRRGSITSDSQDGSRYQRALEELQQRSPGIVRAIQTLAGEVIDTSHVSRPMSLSAKPDVLSILDGYAELALCTLATVEPIEPGALQSLLRAARQVLAAWWTQTPAFDPPKFAGLSPAFQGVLGEIREAVESSKSGSR